MVSMPGEVGTPFSPREPGPDLSSELDPGSVLPFEDLCRADCFQPEAAAGGPAGVEGGDEGPSWL